MCRNRMGRVVGLCAVSFGLGIFASFILPGFLLSFFEAVALVAAGFLLLRASK